MNDATAFTITVLLFFCFLLALIFLFTGTPDVHDKIMYGDDVDRMLELSAEHTRFNCRCERIPQIE